MSTYWHSNGELIAMMIDHHGLKVAWGDTFRFKLDRVGRTMTDEVTAAVYPIPDEWNLT
jgi:hypothetical protein